MKTTTKIDLLSAIKNMDKKNMQSLMLKTSNAKSNKGNNLVPIEDLVNLVRNSPVIQKGVELRRKKLKEDVYKPVHFGRVDIIPAGRIDINIDIQRGIQLKHIGNNILPIFDPRITQPINVIYYAETGRYTCWDGLQTLSTTLILIAYGLIDVEDWRTFPIKANIIDSDLVVPGASCTVAEAVANFGFRTINGSTGRKDVDPYYVMRSEYHGAKLYDSDLTEDLHSQKMWEALLRHNMHPADPDSTKKPGHIGHISGMKNMVGHGKNLNIKPFEDSIAFLSENFIKDDGINASFYMAIAELFVQLDLQKIKTGTKSTQFNTERFATFLKAKYGKVNTSHSFRKIAAKRLEQDRTNQGYKTHVWTDNCSLPYMLDDYKTYCNELGLTLGNLPEIDNMKEFVK